MYSDVDREREKGTLKKKTKIHTEGVHIGLRDCGENTQLASILGRSEVDCRRVT